MAQRLNGKPERRRGAVFGQSVRGETFLGDYVSQQGPGSIDRRHSGRSVSPAEKARYQRSLDASIRRAEAKLKWHAKVGHTRTRRTLVHPNRAHKHRTARGLRACKKRGR